MFCHAILDQNKILCKRNEIPHKDEFLKEKEKILQKIISGECNSFFKAAVEINLIDAKKGTFDYQIS